MGLQNKKNETLYQGRSKWLEVPLDYIPNVNENVIETDDVIKTVERNGFEITYLAYFCDLFDKLGGQKYKIFKYIIKNKNSDNQLIITVRELAEKTKTSTKTVSETLKLLREANLIEQRTGAIMLNPKIAHRGSNKKEAFLLTKFKEFNEFNENEEE